MVKRFINAIGRPIIEDSLKHIISINGKGIAKLLVGSFIAIKHFIKIEIGIGNRS